jgi:hypothetical protein
MRDTFVGLVAMVVVLAGCSIGVVPADQQDAPTSNLAVPDPGPISWRRNLAGIEVVGSNTDPDATELAMLERALDELPDELIEAADLRRVVRVSQGQAEAGTAAYAVGPDLYLIDETFRDLGSGFTTVDLVRLLAHELTHNAQFSELTEADLARMRGQKSADPIPGSDFVATFAARTGWTNQRQPPDPPDWTLAASQRTTTYGASAPEEDMAESVADVIAGGEPEVSPGRVEWVEDWLGAAATDLAGSRPWVPSGASRVVTQQPLHDEEEVARRSSGDHEIVSYAFGGPQPGATELARRIEANLVERGVAGSLGRVDDDRLDRYAGYFIRGDGVGYWIELWDFRTATGFSSAPDDVVVTYAILWR